MPPAPNSIHHRTDEELAALVEHAVKSGITAAVNDPETLGKFWDGAFARAGQRAQAETGRFVIDAAGSIARKIFWFALFGFGVYQVGGWSAVAKLWHAMFGGAG